MSNARRPYRIVEGTADDRRAVTAALPLLDRLPADVRELAVTAWVTAWRSSAYEQLDQMPFAVSVPEYPLVRHVDEVAAAGLGLAATAQRTWGTDVDLNILLAVLLLHDIDKPLIYVQSEGTIANLSADYVWPHGILGARILHDLGFDERVTSVVATHAVGSPFNGTSVEAWLLHQADFFAGDHVLLGLGLTPMYDRR